ncbi:MAG: OmpA family protein, partial [Bacteroidaceae bacterium]|nr:OmpA family protein [Bacteroidaceae bacterium]
MKKLMIALAFAGLGTVAANAQTTIETPELSKYTVATNSFWSNWFIQVGVDASVQNPYRSKFADQFHDGRSYGVNLAIGKYFTPGLALRLHANWDNGLIERKHSFTFDIPEAPNYDAGGYAS